MDLRVGTKGVALITLNAEQGTTPEQGEFGQMLTPVEEGHVVEDRAEEVILGHVAVEASHHLGDLFGIVEITNRRRKWLTSAHGLLESAGLTMTRANISPFRQIY